MELPDPFLTCFAGTHDLILLKLPLLLHFLGVPEAVGVECAADVLLTTAARLTGLMLRAEGGLSTVRLAAGMSHGSVFLDYEGVLGWLRGKGIVQDACRRNVLRWWCLSQLSRDRGAPHTGASFGLLPC